MVGQSDLMPGKCPCLPIRHWYMQLFGANYDQWLSFVKSLLYQVCLSDWHFRVCLAFISVCLCAHDARLNGVCSVSPNKDVME